MERDAIVAGLHDDSTPLREGGAGATAYSEAVGVYLGTERKQGRRRMVHHRKLAQWC